MIHHTRLPKTTKKAKSKEMLSQPHHFKKGKKKSPSTSQGNSDSFSNRDRENIRRNHHPTYFVIEEEKDE